MKVSIEDVKQTDQDSFKATLHFDGVENPDKLAKTLKAFLEKKESITDYKKMGLFLLNLWFGEEE